MSHLQLATVCLALISCTGCYRDSQIASTEPTRNMSDPSPHQLDQKMHAGTDSASFYLFHPKDLAHRVTSPMGWPGYHFACQPEFRAGRLVAFATGGDGGYAFRVTDGPLTQEEQKWHANAWDFRYVVRHNRVYLDGGYALPSDDYFDESEDNPRRWIAIPNGEYKVTVNAIAWQDESSGAESQGQTEEPALPHYVIQFSPAVDLETIPVARTPPYLELSKDWEARPTHSFADHDTFGEEDGELAEQYVVMVSEKNAPIPGFYIDLEVSEAFYEAVYGFVGNQLLPDRIEQLVISSSNQVPCVGVLVEPGSGSRRGGGPWKMSFHAKRLVNVTEFQDTKPWPRGNVEPLERPSSKVSPELLSTLKQRFADYAASNAEYRHRLEYPDFEIERVESMDSATGVTHVLIHHIKMPSAKRLGMLSLSDAQRVEQLLMILDDLASQADAG